MTTLKYLINLQYAYFLVCLQKTKSKNQLRVKQHLLETFNEYKGDVMDYDGMGNYGRFPCAK